MAKSIDISVNRMASVFWMLSWAASFNIAMSLIKLLESSNTLTIAFIRFLFSLAFIAPALLKAPKAFVKTRNLKLHGLNAILRSGAIFCTYYAYAHLPMAFAASIGFTGPFIAVILALLFLQERVTMHKWIAVIVGYVGVLIMVNPQDASLNGAIAASILANICAGFSSVATKKLSREDSSFQVMFYTNLISVLLFGVCLIFTWETPLLREWPLIILIGIAGTISQYSIIQAIRASEVSFVAPYEYIRLLFAVPIGVLLFNEYPTSTSIVGGLIIIACSGFLTYKELQNQRNQVLKVAT